MRQVFENAGNPLNVVAGDLWVVSDSTLTFADPDPERRTLHDTRYVLVMQGDDQEPNHACPSVLVIPLSSNIAQKRPWEDLLTTDESGLSKPSIVKVHLLQPIPREALVDQGTYVGSIPDETLDRIRVHLLHNLGIS